ncbi:MAG: hypothetical protein Fur0025_26180 [Oscillatoriaceae cyanobacterium]
MDAFMVNAPSGELRGVWVGYLWVGMAIGQPTPPEEEGWGECLQKPDSLTELLVGQGEII